MKNQNSCRTSFKIVGEFNPDYVTDLLNLTPDRMHKSEDVRRDGKAYGFALWEIGRCDEYDVKVENQMRKTISVLQDKIHLLNKVREENKVSFYLEIVPEIYVENINPCISPSLDIIDFCHATRTEIDIDMYLYSSHDE